MSVKMPGFLLTPNGAADCFGNKWEKVMKHIKIKTAAQNGSVKKILFFYTVCFFILAFFIYLEFILNKKSLVWQTDAKGQYLIYYDYMGKYLRGLLEGFLHSDFSVPLYDFTIGMGEDINAVIRTNLTDFFSMLVPSRLVEPVYNFWMAARLYIAGLAFLAYCLYRKFPHRNICPAVFLYIFCGYTLNLGSRHPDFTAPMIFLPLLLIALEKLMKRERYWAVFYSGMVALSLVSSYYFLYMNTLAMGVYALLRFGEIFAKKQSKGKEFLQMMGRIISTYLLGCMMAMAFFLPQMNRLFSSMRMSGERPELKELLLYNGNRALSLFTELIGGGKNAGASTFLGFSVIALPVLVVLFVRRWKEYLSLKIAVLVVTVILMFPAGGYLMSGFSAFNNRWTYVVSFVIAVAAAEVLTDLVQMSVLQRILSAAAAAGYWFAVQKNMPGELKYMFTAVILAACTIILIVLSSARDTKSRKKKKNRAAVLQVLVLMTTALNGYLTFSPQFTDKLNEYADWNSAVSEMQNSAFQRLANAAAGENVRCDTHLTGNMQENYSLGLGYMGTSVYNSVLNANLVQYHKEMDNIGISAVHRIHSLDGRTGMEALARTGYYLTQAEQEAYVPYGFVKADECSDESYSVYKNKYLLPFGYTYDSCLSEKECSQLDGLEKQQLMLRSAIVEKIPQNGSRFDVKEKAAQEVSDIKKEIRRIPVNIIEKSNQFKIKNDIYHAKEENTGFVLEYPKKAGYEAYLYFKGLNRNVDYAMVGIQTSDLYKEITVRGQQRDYSLGRENYLVNLGYSKEDGYDTISVTFRKKGKYRMEEMALCYVPMNEYGARIKERSEEGLENVRLETNCVCGKVNLSEQKLMVFSIPYREGWKLLVDGKEQECFKANLMYIGAVLPPGAHDIELRYCTAGLQTGVLLSICGIMIYITILIICRNRQREQQQTQKGDTYGISSLY